MKHFLLTLFAIFSVGLLDAHTGNGTLTLLTPATGVNRLNVTVSAVYNGITVSDSDTTDATGTITASINANPTTGATTQMSITGGNLSMTNMNFVLKAFIFVTVANINTAGMAGTAFTASPPAPSTPSGSGGSFDASLHRLLINSGAISGTVLGDPVNSDFATAPVEGAGSGTGTVNMVAGTADGTHRTFNATVTIPVDFTDNQVLNGTPVSIRVQGTLKAAGSVLIPLFGPCTWTGLASNLWNNAGNWDTLPATGDSLIFPGTTNATNTNDLAGDTTIGGITFSNTANASNFNLSGNRIVLGGNITASDTATTSDTINDAIALDLVLNADRTILLGARHNLNLNGIVSSSGAFGVIKSGSGTLNLNGPNTYGGTTTIAQGRVILNSINATLGSTAAATIVQSGAQLSLTANNFVLADNLTLSGNGLSTSGSTNGALGMTFNSGTFTLDGTITLAGGATISSYNAGTATINISKGIGGTGNLTLRAGAANNGGANFYLKNPCTYTGDTIFSTSNVQGTATIRNDIANALPVGSVLYLNGTAGSTTSTTLSYFLNGHNQTVAGIVGANGTVGLFTFTNNIVGGSGTLSTLTINNSSNFTFSGTIGGSGTNHNNLALVKSGSGTQTLVGTNTYTGATTISQGTLQMASNLVTGSPSISIGNGATLNVTGGGGFALSAGQSVTGTGVTGNVTTTSSTGLIASGNNAISTTSPSNTLTLTRLAVTGTGNTITGGNIQSGGAASLQRGLVVGITSPGVLTITGGMLTTNGTGANADVLGSGSTNTGTLVINGGGYVASGALGRLNLGNAASNGNGVLTLASGSATVKTLAYQSGTSNGTVNLNGGTLTVQEIVSASGSSRVFNFNGGRFVAGANLPAFSGLAMNVKDGGAKIDTNGFSFAISDALLKDGTGGLIKSGAGTLILSGASTYTGGTTVSAGTLRVTNMTGSGTGTGNVIVSAGTLGGNGTISGAVTLGNGTGSADAILAPGNSIGPIATGDLAFNGDGSYAVELNGTSATSDQTHVTGTVTINPATTLAVIMTGTLSAGQRYFIAINNGVDAITGTFFGLAQDTVIGNYDGTDLKISYTGDSVTNAVTGGNDIVLYTNSVYDAWALAKGLTGVPGLENGEGDDPDGDGRINRLEFAFDGNPLSGANDGKIVGKIASVGGSNVLTLTVPVRVGAIFSGTTARVSNPIDGVIYHIQGGYTLADAWPMVIGEVTGPEATAIQSGLPALSDIGGGGADWEYRTFRATDAITANPRGFMRGMVEDAVP
jgi:autotransporter-associated beta strand protein